MTGLWKENIGGWNAKNQKRKKQSRKHTLKDKGKVLIKAFHKGKPVDVREEYEIEHILTDPPQKRSDWCELWSVRKTKNHFCKIGKSFYAIKYGDKWFNHVTYKELPDSREIVALDFIGKEEFEKDPVEEKSSRSYLWAATKTTYYIYGKPVEKWKERSFYSHGHRRLDAQKKVTRRNRARLKTWISKADWDKEIKTHALSKSISWEIY